MKTNIFRIHPHDSIMCGYFCIGFIHFMLKGKTLPEFYKPFFKKRERELMSKRLSKYIASLTILISH